MHNFAETKSPGGKEQKWQGGSHEGREAKKN